MSLSDQSNISVVDFGPFLSGSSGRQAVADAILDSLKSTGFVYLLNHGLPGEDIQAMFDWVQCTKCTIFALQLKVLKSRKFFSQPMETKQLAPHPPSGTHHRGYSAPGSEKVYQYDESADQATRQSFTTDLKESFECGREDDPLMPNIWLPESVLPGFREACLEFFGNCYKIELFVLQALALGLKLPEDYFLPFHTKADNQLRLLHYPSVSTHCEDTSRITAHSDFCTMTLLFQDEVGGLEIEDIHKPGEFKPAPPISGTMILNAGDFLMRWSNDIIRSTIHRVRAPKNSMATAGMIPERYSIPYFCSADLTTVVDCIPGTWSDERPKRYGPTSARDYIMKRLAANY